MAAVHQEWRGNSWRLLFLGDLGPFDFQLFPAGCNRQENKESGSIEASLENAVFRAILERNGDSMKQKRWKDFNNPPSNEDGGSKNGSYKWCIKNLQCRTGRFKLFSVVPTSHPSFVLKRTAWLNCMEAGITLLCFLLAVLCPKQEAAEKGVVLLITR